MSKLEKKIQIRACVFTFSVKLEKWSFDVTNSPRRRKKCAEIKKTAREGRAKLLFLFIKSELLTLIKYAKFVALLLLLRRIFYAPYFGFGTSLTNWIRTSYNKTESSVLNNGWSSNFFKLQRGVRQARLK